MFDRYCSKWQHSNIFSISVVFPRIHVRDPYKRLGISREASEDEIQAARNFLIHKYAGHKPSVDAIEAAHDKIIMQKFYDRKNPKIDIKKKVREVKQSRFVLAVTSRFQTPSMLVIIKTSIAFLVLGILTVLFPTEEGPTLQVAISLMATIYFIYDRLKSKIRAFLYGYVDDILYHYSFLLPFSFCYCVVIISISYLLKVLDVWFFTFRVVLWQVSF